MSNLSLNVGAELSPDKRAIVIVGHVGIDGHVVQHVEIILPSEAAARGLAARLDLLAGQMTRLVAVAPRSAT